MRAKNNRVMKLLSIGKLLMAGTLIGAVVMARAVAQEGQAAKPTAPAAENKGSDSVKHVEETGKPKEISSQASALPSAGIKDILQMLDAGVSKDIIKTYLENLPVALDVSPADLIVLKQRGVSDEIRTTLLKRCADIRTQSAQASAGAKTSSPAPNAAIPAAAVLVDSNRRDVSVHLDPEGYDYFWYNYLYPRTLASANERMGYYSAPYFYGYYPPSVFSPRYSGRYAHPRFFR
jgi:hypothetical protein